MPKAGTRTRKKRNSDSEDEDYVAPEEEVGSKKKVLKKEYGTAATIKPGMKKKTPAKRVPTLKARGSTVETSKSNVEEAASEAKKKKERKRGRWCKKVDPMAEFEEHSSDEEEEEEDAAPAPKSQKLMGDAIKSGAAPSKPKTIPKVSALAPKTAPKRSTRNIPATEKNRVQCLRLMKKMPKPKCLRSSNPRFQIMMTAIQWHKT